MGRFNKLFFCLLVAASGVAAFEVDTLKLINQNQQKYVESIHSEVEGMSLRNDEPEPDQELKCPTKETIEPCTCGIIKKRLNVLCAGSNVTQESIDNTFSSLRSTNNLQSYDTLRLASFSVALTWLKSLDMSSFQNSEIRILSLLINDNLTSITGQSARSDLPAGGINATNFLLIWSSNLTTKGFGNTLKFFDPDMTNLAIAITKIEGGRFSLKDGSGDVEFLPGLSQFTKLNSLNLGGNPITEVSGGQFKRNSKLTSLSLGSKLKTIGDNAFVFSDYSAKNPLTLDLSINQLTDSSFSSIKTNGLAIGQRPIQMNLVINKIDTLSEANFRPFLMANSQNKMDLRFNRLQCDRNMKWLKDNRRDYEKRVLNANCANDNNRSVFESKKIQ